MSKRDQVLILNPASEIKFKGPYTEVVTRSLELSNPSEQRVAFKIKTTTPKRYCVRPNSGTLNPGETTSVSIMLQPNDQEMDKTKHKFMVQSIFLNINSLEGPTDNYWKTASSETLMDTKLKCVFEDDDSPKMQPALNKNPGATGDTEQSKQWQELQELRSENERLKKDGARYRNMALDHSFTTAKTLNSSAASTSSGFSSAYSYGKKPEEQLLSYRNIAVMVLMVLIGILLGKILF